MKRLIYCIAILLVAQPICAANNNYSWWQRAISNALLSTGSHVARTAWNYATIPAIKYIQGPPHTLQEIAAQNIARQIQQNPDQVLNLPESILNLVAKEYYLSVDETVPVWLNNYFEGVSIDDLIRHNKLGNVLSNNNSHLNLQSRNINSLDGWDKIPHIDQVREINLFNNKLTSLPDNFASNLEQLRLEKNHLQELPVNFNPQYLIFLDLDANRLPTLPDNFNPPNLRELHLSRNKLQTLPAHFNPPHLEYLLLINNELKEFPNMFNPQRLRELDITKNPMNEETIAALRQRLPHTQIFAD